MSTTSSTVQELPREPRVRMPEPASVRIYEWCLAVVALAILGLGAARSWPALADQLTDLLPWVAFITACELVPVRVWRNVHIGVSFPVLLAAGMVFAPVTAGLLTFVGLTDIRELRRAVSLNRALWNRSQVALSVMCGSALFHALGGNVRDWPFVVVAVGADLLVDLALNWALVAFGTHLWTELPLRNVVANMLGGPSAPILVSHGTFALLAVLLALAYEATGSWGLAACVVPALLARRVFVRERRLRDASDEIRGKDEMLRSVSEQVAQERRDERIAVAAGLHDEVLPPLFQVHLMGQVVRQDLDSGRLLSLDDDVPGLLAATVTAQEAVRGLIRSLRRSPLGPGGLSTTLRLLARELESQASAELRVDIEDVGGSAAIQLLMYQVAREALTNAVRHSQANNIAVRLESAGNEILLEVQDDGVGFDLTQIDRESHFGLQLMRERARAAAGDLRLVTGKDQGVRILARFPLDLPNSEP